MQLPEKIKERLGLLGEWVAFFGPLIAMFAFFHHANTVTGQRVDATISNFQRSIDEVHKRSDVLHQEFIDLLKERRNQNS